mmetsp:Transcript_123787/g.174515  ORF Transcript_123787/g.174515 Transcript_123787/m.174515 type:complete len:192 (-) Transcript_123787:44-619(-)|eukprot:s2398_g2.t1
MALSLCNLFALALFTVSLAEDPPVAASATEQPAAAEHGKAAEAPGHFVYCSCGVTCKESATSWSNMFILGKACVCSACPEGDSTIFLRGSASQDTAPGTERGANLPARGEEKQHEDEVRAAAVVQPGAAESLNKASIILPAEENGAKEAPGNWDTAKVANFMYCKCGKYCVDSRGITLWNPYCFRYACRPC